ncbi:Protein FAAH-2 [Aphelenchoides avenae]|nr:Protein FAAH-2 [Aphelenchus avenae]
MHRHDPYVPPVDWNEEEFQSSRTLRIGFYADDNWFRPTPPLQRAVYETKDRLERRGHEMVPFIPPDAPRAFQLFTGALFMDGGEYIYTMLKNDLLAENYGLAMTALSLPVCLRRLSAASLDFFYPRMAHFLRSFPRNTSELRKIYEDITEYRVEFAKRMQEQRLDALLCPVQVCPAMRKAEPVLLEPSVSYTALFNLLDYAAGTARVTQVDERDLQLMETSYPESDPWYRLAKESAKGTVGFPVGVQVAAPPYSEELCMRILCEIEGSR